MSNIKFIYFDLGNVLVSFDHTRAFQQISGLTGIAAARVEEILFDGKLQHRYERGEISTSEFHRHFCEQAKTDLSIERLCFAASNIFEPLGDSIQLLKKLKDLGHRLGLLSNTCDCHWRFLLEEQRFGFLHSSFEQLVLSHIYGKAKPDISIYQYAAGLAGCEPGAILFVDDLLENVEGARYAGLDAIQFRGLEGLLVELAKRDLITDTLA